MSHAYTKLENLQSNYKKNKIKKILQVKQINALLTYIRKNQVSRGTSANLTSPLIKWGSHSFVKMS